MKKYKLLLNLMDCNDYICRLYYIRKNKNSSDYRDYLGYPEKDENFRQRIINKFIKNP